MFKKLLITVLLFISTVVYAGSIPLLGAGKSVVSGGIVTLFTASPALNANDTNANTSFRICTPVINNSITQIRVTFQASTAVGLTVSNASIGKRTTGEPLYSNTTLTPLELLFGGNSGFSISANSSITSDWLTISGFSLTTGEQTVVIFDGTSPAGQRFNNANIGVETFYKTGTPSYNISNTIGLGFSLISDTDYSIVSVETQ